MIRRTGSHRRGRGPDRRAEPAAELEPAPVATYEPRPRPKRRPLETAVPAAVEAVAGLRSPFPPRRPWLSSPCRSRFRPEPVPSRHRCRWRQPPIRSSFRRRPPWIDIKESLQQVGLVMIETSHSRAGRRQLRTGTTAGPQAQAGTDHRQRAFADGGNQERLTPSGQSTGNGRQRAPVAFSGARFFLCRASGLCRQLERSSWLAASSTMSSTCSKPSGRRSRDREPRPPSKRWLNSRNSRSLS
jgi:hypothetical protein